MNDATKINDTRKQELLGTQVEHIDIKSFDARPIIDAMKKMSFSSRDTGRAAEIYNQMLADKDCSIALVVGLVAAAITTAQLGTTLLFFLRRRVLLTVIFLVPAAVGAVWLARPDLVRASTVLAVFVLAGVTAVLIGSAGLLTAAVMSPLPE